MQNLNDALEKTNFNKEIPITKKSRTREEKRAYQRRYYQEHKEKAKEYTKKYNQLHRKRKDVGREPHFTAPRQVIRRTYNTYDIMHSPVEKTLKILKKILDGERYFTINTRGNSSNSEEVPREKPRFYNINCIKQY